MRWAAVVAVVIGCGAAVEIVFENYGAAITLAILSLTMAVLSHHE